jgi:hypothetical protein
MVSIQAVILAICAIITAGDITGAWILDLKPDFGGNADSVACTFKQEDRTLSGRCGTGAPITGKVEDRQVTFYVNTGRRDELTATFTAELDDRGGTMKGKWHLIDSDGKDREGLFEARKQ